MPYNDFVAIGYMTLTGKKTTSQEVNPESDPIYEQAEKIVDYTVVKDFGNKNLHNKEYKEAEQQLLLLGMVIYQAHKYVQNDNKLKMETVLKIFVAPEFLLRPKEKDKNGEYAYPREVKDDILSALDCMFSGKDFNDWVIVPGTVVWTWRRREVPTFIENPDAQNIQDRWVLNKDEKSKPKSITTLITMNTGMIKSGGTKGKFTTVSKQNTSGIDHIDFKYQPQRQKVTDYLLAFEKPWEMILIKENIYFGLEICRDHEFNIMALKKMDINLREEKLFKQGKYVLDFHLLTACGVTTCPNSVAAGKKGYFIRMDGIEKKKDNFQIFSVNNQGFKKDIQATDEIDNAFIATSALQRLKDLIGARKKEFDKDWKNKIDLSNLISTYGESYYKKIGINLNNLNEEKVVKQYNKYKNFYKNRFEYLNNLRNGTKLNNPEANFEIIELPESLQRAEDTTQKSLLSNSIQHDDSIVRTTTLSADLKDALFIGPPLKINIRAKNLNLKDNEDYTQTDEEISDTYTSGFRKDA